MDTRLTDLDTRVGSAFDNFVKEALSSVTLGKIARQPKRVCEATISEQFRDALVEQFGDSAKVVAEESWNYPGGKAYRHDIVVRADSEGIAVVEVKTPFTNHDGITNKTRKAEHLPKDVDALKAALDAGASATYCLVIPIGCYPVDASGNMLVLSADSVQKNEQAVKNRYRIQWPTRRDYEASGKREVDRAMGVLTAERNLGVKRIMGWTHIDLLRPRSDLHSFIDCALYKVEGTAS